MIEFKVKARGNNPAGKPKVYFTCAPGDEKYFDDIVNDILKATDCAVYYADGEVDTSDPDYAFMLGSFQLVVFPVTAELLYLPSRALEYDIPFFKNNGIPLLPLMQASGLDREFNIKVGEIQYLDKFTPSQGALPYEKKLNDFLSNVLISNELIEKVRSAFDAYVFLSYRKKDRRYANEVMRRIHEFDFTRDIAIWFDEFLTPGENFNDAIRDALNKSELFTMVVTPNLINEKNYVMEEEYPRAKSLGKKILPVESVKTDGEELKKLYPNIPATVEVGSPVISDELLNCLRNIAIRENDTPIHNYYIALAYLYGIDLEVDKPRALSILKESASAGCIEAIEKLAQVYMTGECGVVDMNNALLLRERAFEYYRKKKDAIEQARCAKLLAAAVRANPDLPQNKRKKEVKRYLTLALKEYQRENRDGKYDGEILALYTALIGESDSERELEGFVKNAQRYANKSGDEQYELAKACFMEKMGFYYLDLGDLARASEFINGAVDYYAAKKEYSLEAKLHLIYTDMKLGELFEGNGELDAARNAYEKAIEYARDAYKAAPVTGGILVRGYYLLGSLYYSYLDDADKAERCLLKCVELAQELESISEFLSYSAYAPLKMLAGLHGSYGDDTHALEYDMMADAIASIVKKKYGIADEVEEEQPPVISDDEADAWAQREYLRGKALMDEEKTEEAIAAFCGALEKTTETEGVVLVCYDLAMAYWSNGDNEKAKEYLTKALELCPQTPFHPDLTNLMKEQLSML